MHFYKIVVDSDIFYVSRQTIDNTVFEAVLNKQKYDRVSYDHETLTFYVDADPDSFKNIITKMRGYPVSIYNKNTELIKKYNMDYKYFIEDIKLNIKLHDSPVIIRLDIDNSDIDTENIIDDIDEPKKSMIKLIPEMNDSNISNVAIGSSYYYSPDNLDNQNYPDYDISSDNSNDLDSSDNPIKIKIVNYNNSISSDSDNLTDTSDIINQMFKSNETKCSPNSLSPIKDEYTIKQHNPLHDIFKSYIQIHELEHELEDELEHELDQESD
jgi:hypothetical protein